MLIERLDPKKFVTAYDIDCQGFQLGGAEQAPPVSTTWCRVPPGGTARAHKHQEHEAFLILKGSGIMTVDSESQPMTAGDAVFMPPFSVHELKNSSQTEDLLFLDLCWEVLPEAAKTNQEKLTAGQAARPKRVLITATPPTPNGDLHVGHLSGPYLGADIYRRYQKMRGVDARYLSGIDDHQTYVVKKAAALGKSPRDVASSFGAAMARTWEGMKIRIEHVGRPYESSYHSVLVQKVFHDLYAKGAIVAREAPTLFCEGCELYLFEARVHGTCPHCHKGCDGNACEDCGRPNDCVDLLEPRCARCGQPPATRTVRRLYFPLAPYEAELRAYFGRAAMNPHLRSLCDALLADGLPEIAVSQVGDWGIPVGLPGFEDQQIYVWFEMGPGYLAASRELWERSGDGEGWEPLWKDRETEIVQFFGFDNGYYHAVLFPAISLAWDREIRLPDAFVTNEFYFYEGSKFSTSRNHAMWGQELLEKVPVDVARLYLAFDGPERENNNFRFAELQSFVQRRLVEGWNPWLQELEAKLQDSFSGGIPGTGAWTEEQQRFYSRLLELNQEAATVFEASSFSAQRAARILLELVRITRRFAQGERHWRHLAGRYEEWRTAVALEVLAAKILAQVAAPLMPAFAAGLERALGAEKAEPVWEETPEFVHGGPRAGRFDDLLFAPVAG
jgi:methionyl-tRNA synthetase